jgi:hypothetical protein
MLDPAPELDPALDAPLDPAFELDFPLPHAAIATSASSASGNLNWRIA